MWQISMQATTLFTNMFNFLRKTFFLFLCIIPGVVLAFLGMAVYIHAGLILGISKLLFAVGVEFGVDDNDPKKAELKQTVKTLYDDF